MMRLDICNVCGEKSLDVIAPYSPLPRVSSDCKPIAAGGEVGVCRSCGGIQKPVTPAFLEDIGRIYAGYDVYYQGGGMEQLVHDAVSNTPLRRSELLSRRLGSSGLLRSSGRMIDLGCGNGAFMHALATHLPGWSFNGLELDRRYEKELHAIPRFSQLLLGDVKTLEGRFDLISMIHALEHFIDPFDCLLSLKRNLNEDGLIFIEIPNVEENPFDLLIADHVSHFTPCALEALLLRAGYEVVRLETDWVKKELSVLARPQRAPAVARRKPHASNLAEHHIRWLGATLDRARSSSGAASTFGLFGTSIAATWLSGALGERISFYLDEDASRIGKTYFGRPVLAPGDAPRGSTVFVGLAPVIASVVVGKLKNLGVTVAVPPALDAV